MPHDTVKREHPTRNTNHKLIDEQNSFDGHDYCQNNSSVSQTATKRLKCRRYPTGDTNAMDGDGKTLLHIATEWGRTEIAKFLIEEKLGDVNARDNEKDTPLHNSRIETCEILILAGIVYPNM